MIYKRGSLFIVKLVIVIMFVKTNEIQIWQLFIKNKKHKYCDNHGLISKFDVKSFVIS